METKRKYLYLLRFKDTPLIKIGEGTKDENSKYNRIQNHLRTYGHVFDLEESYEIIAPKSYSISALERQLKDITMSYYPTEEVMKDYCGKDGATEIRTIESLAKILELIEFQKKFISLSLTKGITIIKPERPVKPQNENKSVKQKVEKENIDFPFTYNDTMHLMEIILKDGYQPNLHKIKRWAFKEEKYLQVRIEAEIGLADNMYLNDHTITSNGSYTTNKIMHYLSKRSFPTLKRYTNYKYKDDFVMSESYFSLCSTIMTTNSPLFIITFSINADVVYYKTVPDFKSKTNQDNIQEWFRKHIVNPLIENIPDKRVEDIMNQFGQFLDLV